MAATPASNALPPLVRTSNAGAVVSGCPADTPALRPITGGRWAALGAAPICTATTNAVSAPITRNPGRLETGLSQNTRSGEGLRADVGILPHGADQTAPSLPDIHVRC